MGSARSQGCLWVAHLVQLGTRSDKYATGRYEQKPVTIMPERWMDGLLHSTPSHVPAPFTEGLDLGSPGPKRKYDDTSTNQASTP